MLVHNNDGLILHKKMRPEPDRASALLHHYSRNIRELSVLIRQCLGCCGVLLIKYTTIIIRTESSMLHAIMAPTFPNVLVLARPIYKSASHTAKNFWFILVHK